MQSVVLSACFVGVLVGTALAELKVRIKLDATLKCEAHKSCHDEMEAMFVYTSWQPKVLVGEYPPARVLYDMEPNQTTLHVGYDENLFGGDSYYLQIDHVCPCSNVTSGNACEWTMDPRISLCIDLEDKMKGPPPTDDTFRLDLGEVDLSTPWKYYRCPSTVAPCLP